MRYSGILFLSIICLNISYNAFSQSDFHISKPELEQINNHVKITYDIFADDINAQYRVWVEITNEDGKALNAIALTGDIGIGIRRGSDKVITWDPVLDGVSLEKGVYVQVLAEKISSSTIESPPNNEARSSKVNTTSVVLQSLLLPGIGLSRATGQLHWLRGVAGYVCLGGAIVFNRMAANAFESYQEEEDTVLRENYFNTSVTQDQVSEVLAYSTIGIWVTDIIWNIVGAGKLNREVQQQASGFYLQPSFDAGLRAPVLTMRYTF